MIYDIAILLVAVVWFVAGYAVARAVGAICHHQSKYDDDEAGA